jgi:hypothetical protein
VFDYDDDVLARRLPARNAPVEMMIRTGMVVEVLGDGFVGRVTGADHDRVRLEDRRGRARVFALDGTFVVDDTHVRLRFPPQPTSAPTSAATASGSLPRRDRTARVARTNRILVEGLHDAELVEKVWGEDLRDEGIVVEILDGIDGLDATVAAFRPGPARRLGVLVDHLVPGSKESRMAARASGPHVLVTGHPFVDVWAAIKPATIAVPGWPDVPRDEEFKRGLLARLGSDETPAAFWRRLLAAVDSYTDLDRSLVGAVERLLDFLTETDPP